jgi:hypothetical protein
MENITFENNTAPYGSNIASFPYKIVVNETKSINVTFNSVASGQIYPFEFELSLFDTDDQVMNLDNC